MRIYTVKTGAGRERDYFAIKAWMDKKGISIKQFAEKIGVHRSTVSHTIRGARNHRKVLRELAILGCPIRILSLPRDMR